VRWGTVYRADALTFTADGLAAYRALGIRAVFDLRGLEERTRLPDPVDSVHLPVLAHVERAGALPAWSAAVAHDDGERFLRTVYGGLLEHAAPVFGELFTQLADAANRPAMFHCTGGKDRTGMASAILLELLGVGRDDVLDDYELTTRYRLREHRAEAFAGLLEAGMGPEAAAAVFGTPRWVMAETLADLDAVHGGAEAYLTSRGGMGRDVVAALRDDLLD
jgi:protein-tyrosine phosphatase